MVGVAAVGYSFLNPEINHFVCDGVKVDQIQDSRLVQDRSRLGLTFREFNPLVFWLADDERYTLDYSLNAIDPENSDPSIPVGGTIPIRNDSTDFVSAEYLEAGDGEDIRTSFVLELVAGYVQFSKASPEVLTTFDGFCEIRERVYF